jgi:hypothetical protein|tara:strand:- start:89 stop:214 length:126 start_codon:yes stop_codon:yes gene_type:complete
MSNEELKILEIAELFRSLNEDNKYYVIKLLPKIMETSIEDD